MGPVKDRYINYEEAGDEFLVRTMSGIYSLTKEFGISPAYFELKNYLAGNKYQFDIKITENLVRKEEVLQFFLH